MPDPLAPEETATEDALAALGWQLATHVFHALTGTAMPFVRDQERLTVTLRLDRVPKDGAVVLEEGPRA